MEQIVNVRGGTSQRRATFLDFKLEPNQFINVNRPRIQGNSYSKNSITVKLSYILRFAKPIKFSKARQYQVQVWLSFEFKLNLLSLTEKQQ